MSREQCHLSEDDIRTKVVYLWLKDCGIADSAISIEYSINLKIGHGQRTIHSRSDVLVRNDNGLNLMVIEVKKPEHKLNDNDQWQSISYARSLADGGIAPFAIVTNGSETHIYDSISAEIISEISNEHPYIINGFKPTGDALNARAEALEYLITLSAENLLAFCKAQVAQRMALLKDEDINSGKKYVPRLYVERSAASADLRAKITQSERNIVLVVGPPQHGKTCFVCRSVENHLEQGTPCLLYPAVALTGGVLQSIAADFEWSFREALTHAQIVSRLSRLLAHTRQKLLIFIDGWNEMKMHAVELNQECSRFPGDNIKIILSTTSSSVTRLLKDSADNLGAIASSVNLTYPQISKLASEPLRNVKKLGIVQIDKFTDEELIAAKKIYEDSFDVKFNLNSNLPKDPFYLRLASERYKGSEVPEFATRTELIHASLTRKGLRQNIDSASLFRNLLNFAKVIFTNDAPVCLSALPEQLFQEGSLSRWLESAIIIQLDNEFSLPFYDFYYTHDRDYCIALQRNWLNGLGKFDRSELTAEIDRTLGTDAGTSALRWFLTCPEYVENIELLFAIVYDGATINLKLQKVLSDVIFNQFVFHKKNDFLWLEKYLLNLIQGNAGEAESENTAELIFSYLVSIDKKNDPLAYRSWLRLLVKYDTSINNIGFSDSLITELYGERELHSRDGTGRDTPFEFALFEDWLLDDDATVAANSAIVIAGIAPEEFLKIVPAVALKYQLRGKGNAGELFIKALDKILGNLLDYYYGDMCPGWLDHHADREYADNEVNEDIYYEYILRQELWLPVLRMLKLPSSFQTQVGDLLDTLKESSNAFGHNGELRDDKNIQPDDPNQLSLEF